MHPSHGLPMWRDAYRVHVGEDNTRKERDHGLFERSRVARVLGDALDLQGEAVAEAQQQLIYAAQALQLARHQDGHAVAVCLAHVHAEKTHSPRLRALVA